MHKDGYAAQTAFYYSWKDNTAWKQFPTGISLHGHTWYSHEGLSFLPATIANTYVLPRILRWAENRFYQKWQAPLDYSQGYWTSPVSPEQAYKLEADQILSFGLKPLVSITDHDSIEAQELLPSTPISLEWTAPYNGAIFHIGVHNLPAEHKHRILASLQAYSKNPDPAVLGKILSELNALPDIITILNHPLSDQGRIGFEIHAEVVLEVLERYRHTIHALEVNALQSWDINRRVTTIAEEKGFPVIAGGDRHGFEPNGAINLTNASTFAEFAHEVRHDLQTAILFMPQCNRPLKLRYSENVQTVMAEYPELPGRVYWHDRVFFKCPDGVTRALSHMTKSGGPVLGAMNFGVDALGVMNLIARPITPLFGESDREIY